MRVRSRQTLTSSENSFPLKEISSSSEELPRIPKGTLSGLLSFIRGAGAPRSQWGKSQTQTLGYESHVELRSVDDSYHAYLNPNYPKPVRGKAIGTRVAYV